MYTRLKIVDFEDEGVQLKKRRIRAFAFLGVFSTVILLQNIFY